LRFVARVAYVCCEAPAARLDDSAVGGSWLGREGNGEYKYVVILAPSSSLARPVKHRLSDDVLRRIRHQTSAYLCVSYQLSCSPVLVGSSDQRRLATARPPAAVSAGWHRRPRVQFRRTSGWCRQLVGDETFMLPTPSFEIRGWRPDRINASRCMGDV